MSEKSGRERSVAIGVRLLQSGERPFVIAEAGVNHDGDLDTALRLIDIAVAAGADAVKFQTFRTDDLVTDAAPLVEYQKRGKTAATQRQLLAALELAEDAFAVLKDVCDERGILFLSTPHTVEAVDVLAPLVPAFKVGSADLTNPLLLERVAATGLPVLLATGMGTLPEVQRAVGWLEGAGARDIVVMHCTTAYPCPVPDANLAVLATLAAALDRPVGYSDHTPGIWVSVMAAALGAVVIEKHFTYDREAEGPDHAASLEPTALGELVTALRQLPEAVGRAEKEPTAVEVPTIPKVRKSLTAKVAIAAGSVIVREHLSARRPQVGIGAEALDRVVGRRAARDIAAGAALEWDDVTQANPQVDPVQ
ncbi:MAG: N-acetylneuraminate synthase family protein [Planctomycetota bacterium]